MNPKKKKESCDSYVIKHKHPSVVLFLLWRQESGKMRIRFLSLVICVDGRAVLQLWVHLHHHCVFRLHILQSGFSLFPTTSRYTVEPPATLSITHTLKNASFVDPADAVCLISSRKRWLRGEKAETVAQKAESDHQAGRAETIAENQGSLQQLWFTVS